MATVIIMREIIKLNGKKNIEVAKELGLTRQAFNSRLNLFEKSGKGFSINELKKISFFLGKDTSIFKRSLGG